MALVNAFQKTITTAGTDEALKASRFVVRNAAVKALAANTGIIYLGAEGVSATTGYPLAAGESIVIAAIDTRGSDGSYDLRTFWANASAGGDKVAVFYNHEEDADPTT